MRFESIHLINFRQYDDVYLKFSDGINLIEAGNGVGKSTLMAALIFAMFGYEQSIESGFIKVTHASPLINLDLMSSHEEKVVSVELVLMTTGKDRYTIKRTYNHDTEKQDINVQKEAKKKNYYIEDVSFEEISGVIPEEFIPLLFFDGERIKKIEDSIESRSKGFQEEIEKILKNSELNDARLLIKRSREKISRETEFCNPRIKELEELIKSRESFIDNGYNTLSNFERRLDNGIVRKKEIDLELKDIDKLKQLTEELEEVDLKINDMEDKVNKSMYDAKREVFTNLPKIIKMNIDEKIVNELGGTNANFKIKGIEQGAIDIIIEEGECICGTKLSEDHKIKLEELRKALPPESFRVILSAKLDNKEDEIIKLENYISEYTGKFIETSDELKNTKDKKNLLSEKIRAISSSDGEKLIKERSILDSECDHLKVEIAKSEEKLVLAEKEYNKLNLELKQELAKEKENEVERKSIQLMEEAEKEIKKYINDRKSRLRDIMQEAVNKYANELLSEDIYIELDASLRPIQTQLKNKSEALSTGQSVIVSLAYLFALMKASKEEVKFGHHVSLTEKYPIVFDGVTATLDDYHTRKVIKYIENSDTQFIIFANTKEVKLFEDKLSKEQYKKIIFSKEINSNKIRVEE